MQTLPAKLAYRSLFGFDHFVARDFGVIRTITKRSKFVRLATFTVVTMIAATALYVGAGTTNHIVSTLVSRGEGTLAGVLATPL